ncbi:hypothetical protein [Achromobacter deleyi]|uniref:hypothetical protein n=1 Tax=Achromobacter deleyi TaxID=1353891 RepID=UPI00158389AC|nr:hypothetical protein [Achromobacter deleyi]
MTTEQRAAYFLEKLLAAKDKYAAIQSIKAELDSLVFSKNQAALTTEDKLRIIEELELQAKNTRYSAESIEFKTFEKSITASDNSSILDVISAMKQAYAK